MVIISDIVYQAKVNTVNPPSKTEGQSQTNSSAIQMNGIKTSVNLTNQYNHDDAQDVPWLVSDHDESEGETHCSSDSEEEALTSPAVAAVECIRREMKREGSQDEEIKNQNKKDLEDGTEKEITALSSEVFESSASSSASSASSVAAITTPVDATPTPSLAIDKPLLTAQGFKQERTQLMTIVVKYMATKINNSFPPAATKHTTSRELPLDKFLLILTSRLRLSLSQFMQGMIYLFRYMDIVYLLRYLNQSNNFANYNEMQFSVKKLVVGCFNLSLSRYGGRAAAGINWQTITGLSQDDVNAVVNVLTSRMNGKLSIKQVELVKMKSEILRFVKMVTRAI